MAGIDWSKAGAFGAGILNDTLWGIPEAILSRTNPDIVKSIKSANPDAYQSGQNLSAVAGLLLPGAGVLKAGKAIKAASTAKGLTRAEKISKMLGMLADEAKTTKYNFSQVPKIDKREIIDISDEIGFGDISHIMAKGKKIQIPEYAKRVKASDLYTKEEIESFMRKRKLGESLREKYPNYSLSRALQEDIYDSNSLTRDAGIENYGPASYQFFATGFEKKPIPSFNVGWRYGKKPELGVSRNFRDDITEKGISFMQVADGNKIDTLYEMLNGDLNNIHWFGGYELPYLGSDGEPLMVALRDLGGK